MHTFLLILLICIELTIEAESDPAPQIEISTLVNCADQDVVPPEGFVCETEITGEASSKSFNAKFSVPFDVDQSLKYHCSLKKWVDEQWKAISFSLSGTICEDVPKYLPGLWEKLSKAAGVPQSCPIKAGSYSVSGFTADSKDVKLPFVIPGKYLVTALVLKNNTPVVCKQSEVTISKA